MFCVPCPVSKAAREEEPLWRFWMGGAMASWSKTSPDSRERWLLYMLSKESTEEADARESSSDIVIKIKTVVEKDRVTCRLTTLCEAVFDGIAGL